MENKDSRVIATLKTDSQRLRNAAVFAEDLKAGKLEVGKWASYSDGKLVRIATTRAEAVTGLALGYYCTLVGRDPSKVVILL
jgi:hypothetical protein